MPLFKKNEQIKQQYSPPASKLVHTCRLSLRRGTRCTAPNTEGFLCHVYIDRALSDFILRNKTSRQRPDLPLYHSTRHRNKTYGRQGDKHIIIRLRLPHMINRVLHNAGHTRTTDNGGGHTAKATHAHTNCTCSTPWPCEPKPSRQQATRRVKSLNR